MTINRQDLKCFNRKELEDIILSKACFPIFERTILSVIQNKREEKHLAYETKIETLQMHKEEWIKELKNKYGVETDKELFTKMSYEETCKYISMIKEINNVFDEENKLFDEEEMAWKKRYVIK